MQPLPYGSASEELFLPGISQERRPRVMALSFSFFYFLSDLCLAHVPGLSQIVCMSTLFLGANTSPSEGRSVLHHLLSFGGHLHSLPGV